VQPFLEQLARAKNYSLYAAAITYANDCPSEMTRGIILAVAVELSLRATKQMMFGGKS
jgi:hypothetical protein